MKTPYSDLFEPPAPFLTAQVSTLADDAPSSSLPALVDTGADTNLIPATLIGQLRLAESGYMRVQSYEGEPRQTPAYDIIIRVAQFKLVGLPVVAFSADYILLGRDVLNYLRLLLDGPALTLEILEAANR